MINNLDPVIIIWKKINNEYHCLLNNCDMVDTDMNSYLKQIDYADHYNKIIETHETQKIKKINLKIILQYIPENIILEIRTLTNSIQILSTISHKIRNPLTNILGILKFINESKLNKLQQKNINILNKSCYDMVEVVNDVIDIINLNEGDVKLNLEKININNLLHQCYEVVSEDIKNKNLNLKIVVDKNVPDVIIVDVAKLKQIIINLLNNSIQHTDIGGIIINVSILEKNNDHPFKFVETTKPKYNILFSVKDSGSGLDAVTKKYVESILDMKKCDPNPYKYSGLGLIIAKNLCELMNGHIWFKSEQNICTVFQFNIICNSAV